MQYKAIISDVDGTLIQQAKKGLMRSIPTKRVTEAVSKIKDNIHFGIATSRPLHALKYLFDHLSLTGPCIINGGSLIVDPITRKILWEKTLDTEVSATILEILKKKNIVIEAHTKEQGKVTSYENASDLHFYNIFPAELTEEKADELHKELMSIPSIAINKAPSFTPRLWGFDITHAEATKQHGILQVAEMLGISTEEIIGVGDGYNDFPLLMACGLKVAMGNAVEDLKAIADYVAPTVDDDGLADVIEKFIV